MLYGVLQVIKCGRGGQLQLLSGILEVYAEIFTNQSDNVQSVKNDDYNKINNKQNIFKSKKRKDLRP